MVKSCQIVTPYPYLISVKITLSVACRARVMGICAIVAIVLALGNILGACATGATHVTRVNGMTII